MSRVMHRSARYAVAAAFILAVWLVSTEPWGLGMFQLFVFTAPGALLGLGAGWLASATKPSAWTWRRARNAALLGALTLPPVLGFIIGLDGNDRSPRLLVGFVRSAWLALAVGGAVAMARLIRGKTAQRRRRRRRAKGVPVRARVTEAPLRAPASGWTTDDDRIPGA